MRFGSDSEPLMANHSYRKQRKVEREFVKQELREGRIAVVAQASSLVLAGICVVVAVICALQGGDWRIVGSLVGASAALVRVAVVARRRSTR